MRSVIFRTTVRRDITRWGEQYYFGRTRELRKCRRRVGGRWRLKCARCRAASIPLSVRRVKNAAKNARRRAIHTIRVKMWDIAPPPGQLSPGNHSRGHLPPVPDANPKMCAFLFCKSFPPQPFLFSYPGSLHGFSRLFTVISEHVFYFLVFLSLHFLVVGSVR